jgi:hypothetical protein
MIWLGAFLIALPGAAVDCESYVGAYDGSMQDEVSCWRQSHDIWEGLLSEALSRISELERMVGALSTVQGVPVSGMVSSAADFGLFEVVVPAGWIVDVSGGEPRLAGLAVPAGVSSADLRGVSTLVMAHPLTDEDPIPVILSVTVAPRMGGVSQHILWEDGVIGGVLPYVAELYGGLAYWDDLGSARGSESYLREGGLEIDGIVAYRSATYTVFDDDMVYYVGLSAPPHTFEGYRDLLDMVYDTFVIE